MGRYKNLCCAAVIIAMTAIAGVRKLHGREVNGQVVATAARTPLPGAEVKLLKRNHSLLGNLARAGEDAAPTLLARTRTDSNGRFSFKIDIPGRLQVEVYDARTRSSAFLTLHGREQNLIIEAFPLPPPPRLLPPR